MEMDLRVKLEREMNITDLSGEKVMVDFETGKYYLIKGTGNDIWDMIQQEVTVGQIVDKLLHEYDIDKDTCVRSVTAFLNNLKDSGLISLARA